MSDPDRSARALISGRRRGPVAAILRTVLLVLTPLYRLALGLRSLAYRIGLRRVHRPARPVISIGNLTVGGTGKTPFVVHIARGLLARGIRPGVVSRGYRAAPGGTGDETRMVRAAVPDVIHVEDRHRARGAARAIEFGAGTIILDDAFQHLACARDLDIVLIDATEPFGHGHLLPRGFLREPTSALRRADFLVVTRTDQVPAEDVRALVDRLASLAPGAPIALARHAPILLSALAGGHERDPSELAGCPVGVISALGNPEAFERTLRDLGARVVATRRHPDHHDHDDDDLASAREAARAGGARFLVTTTKDAVKLLTLADAGGDPPVLVLEVGIEIDEGEERLWREIMARAGSIRSND